MTMTLTLNSHIIRQKSVTVWGSGPWAAIYALEEPEAPRIKDAFT